jgi:hypothetical protein
MSRYSRIEPLTQALSPYLSQNGASSIHDIAAYLRCSVRDARLAIDRARARRRVNIVNVQRYVFELRAGEWRSSP